jgi:hypothetical protein
MTAHNQIGPHVYFYGRRVLQPQRFGMPWSVDVVNSCYMCPCTTMVSATNRRRHGRGTCPKCYISMSQTLFYHGLFSLCFLRLASLVNIVLVT